MFRSRPVVTLIPHCAVFVLVLAGMLPRPSVAATPLSFEPHDFETMRHGSFAAEVAFLDVPLRHDEPDSARTRLRVLRLPATGGDGSAAPVVYLAGGPGGSGVGTARGPRWPVFDRVRRETDVLLLDQRGTGLSERPPPCPHEHHFDDDQVLDPEPALTALRETAIRCIAHWRELGIDLDAYTTVQSAHDVELLRQALDVPRISLWGMSYGTHLALAYLRLYEDRAERVVLLGSEGPDHTVKLPLSADALLADLAQIAAASGFEDLAGSTRRVLEALRQEPALGRSYLRGGRTVRIGQFDAQLALAAALGRRSTQRLLPLAVRRAEASDFDLLAELVLAVRGHLSQFQAMPLVMDVASGQSPQRRRLVETQAQQSLFGNALNFPFPELGDDLGLPDLGEDFRSPLRSSIPTLFVSGTLDGRTPLANAQELSRGFSRSAQLIVRHASHDDELWLGHPDIAERIAAFLAGTTVSDHELEVAPPDFSTSTFALLTEAIGIGPLAAATTTVLALVLAPILIWRRRRRRHRRRNRA